LIERKGGLQERLRTQGYDLEILQGSSLPARVRSLRHKIRVERPDIVHATLHPSCLVTRFACIGMPVRQINSLVNTSYDPVRLSELKIAHWKLATMRIVDGLTSRHLGDRFHAITEAVRDEAVTVLGVNPSLITVIPRGRRHPQWDRPVEQIRSKVRHDLGIGEDMSVLLNVGRQDAQKGQVDLVRAFSSLHLDHSRAVLLVAGREGDASEAIREALDQNGNPPSIRFLGHRTDVLDLLAAADIFVFPSRYEGLGGALIEAMSVGVPIIASDAPAVSEVLGGGEHGMLVQRGDVAALADAMSSMLADEDLRRSFAECGLRRFSEHFELSHIAELTAKLYNDVLSTSRQQHLRD
ncbi:MAG: glycosyltransferase family 4 protein, partial [Microthrixaceae bacterium]|nr:glycosyltransferase family 4 protein [Microthrixaceae bacterium]